MYFKVPVEILYSINISPTHALNFTIYCDRCFYATKLDCIIRVYLMYLCSLFPLETILSCKPYWKHQRNVTVRFPFGFSFVETQFHQVHKIH